MDYLPAKLDYPLFLNTCWAIKPKLIEGSNFMYRHGAAIEEAVEAGLDEKAAKSILLIFWAGQVLRKDDKRQDTYGEFTKIREGLRDLLTPGSDNKYLAASTDLASQYSVDGLEAIEAHVFYGILLDQKFQVFSQAKILPLCRPLSRIFYGTSADKRRNIDFEFEESAFEALRQRYRRIKNQKKQNEVRERALTYAHQVYAVFERKFKLRTYRERL